MRRRAQVCDWRLTSTCSAWIERRKALARSPVAVARATLRQALLETGGLAEVDGGHVDRLLQLARSPAPSGRRLPLPGGREARFTHQGVRLERRANRAPKAVSSSRRKA